MSESDFLRDDAKLRATQVVKSVEAQTSAELVIAVRRKSGDYRAAAYHFGFVVMGVVVVCMLVSPQVYSIEAMALDGLFAFLAGALLCWLISPLRRLFVLAKTRKANVDTAGRAAFYDLGISRTSGRNGILVFVSTVERECAVVPDIGIDAAKLGTAWSQACTAIRGCVKRADLEGFLSAVNSLGPVLGAAMPRAADDVNELPDEVQ